MKPYVLILCGGVGSRLWPLSRQHLPKQFLPLMGSKTFFQEALDRALKLTDPERIWVITTEALKAVVYERIKHWPIQMICEPYAKNTGSAIVYAMTQMPCDETPCLMMPSDHWIETSPFLTQVQQALPLAKTSLVLFGLKPDHPATNFGYIEMAEGEESFRPVLSFIEKPNSEQANLLIQKPNIYWNSGIFLWTKKLFFEELKKVSFDLKELCEKFDQNEIDAQGFFEKVPPLPIDRLLLERSQNVLCSQAQFQWKDLGTWKSIQEFFEEHSFNNPSLSDSSTQIDCENCLIINKNSQQKVFTLGLTNQVLIVTEDSVVCLPLSESDRIQELLAKVKKDGLVELL
jgi:mannose-1-phosphate guanylyltransferase/mannose-6-phosphate isomerase